MYLPTLAEPTLPPTVLTRSRYPDVVVQTNDGVLLTRTASSVLLPSTTWRSGQTKPSAGHPGLSPLVTCPFTRRKAARVYVLTCHECMFFSRLGNCMYQQASYVENRPWSKSHQASPQSTSSIFESSSAARSTFPNGGTSSSSSMPSPSLIMQ